MEDASTLLDQKHELEVKQALLGAFKQHFIMSEDELLLLTSNTSPVNEDFFAVLKRTKQIHSDCQTLLGTENQRLGLELMEQSSHNLNAGYQKLFRWTQREFKSLNLENPQISSVIRKAIRALAERPTLFRSCLDFFVEAREHVLTDAFYAALTGSGSESAQNPATKPIEFHSHDPLRYVGDMLAWTHSATVSEREALEILFISEEDEMKLGFEAGREAEPWSAAEDPAFDGEKALSDIVDRNTAGVARALRQRVEQVFQNHDDAVLLYRISNLIVFYTSTLTKLMGASSNILTTLAALKDSALKHYRETMAEAVSSIQSDSGPPSSDLGIPEFLDEALARFAALLKSFDSSLTPGPTREQDFEPIISQALNPFLAACEKMSKQLSAPDSSIFAANCALAAKSTMIPYPFTEPSIADLDGQLTVLKTDLVEYQHAFFLHTSGLHPMLSVLSQLGVPLSTENLVKVPSLDEFQPSVLTNASTTLDEFLPSALMDAMENLHGLGNREVARTVTSEAADRFCEDFEVVESALAGTDEIRCKSVNGDGDEEDGDGERRPGTEGPVRLKDLFPRTSGEIRVLLS